VDFLTTILYPLEWVVANIMVIWHQLLSAIGLDPASGAAWALSIVGLVVTIRVILIPLFVKQIKASRAMQMIAPELKAVQAKYKGKKDQASREAMSRETMELYAKHKTNPFSSCMPMLIQAPIFFALFRVLNGLEGNGSLAAKPIGLLTQELKAQAAEATIFGAKLSESFLETTGNPSAKIVSAVLIIAMVSTTFLTQRQLTRKNMPKAALEGPMARQQQILMYALPFIFVITGPNFPVGVLIYWTTTNLWTMGQQYYVIKRNPTPGSEAERIYLEKQAVKQQARAIKSGETTLEQIEAERVAEIEAARGQRQQPKKGAPRSKRAAGAKPAESTAVVPAAEGELVAAEEEVSAEAEAPAAPAPKAKRGGSGKQTKQ
jgi:YidC/Oxa1 family membrane protein insertase